MAMPPSQIFEPNISGSSLTWPFFLIPHSVHQEIRLTQLLKYNQNPNILTSPSIAATLLPAPIISHLNYHCSHFPDLLAFALWIVCRSFWICDSHLFILQHFIYHIWFLDLVLKIAFHKRMAISFIGKHSREWKILSSRAVSKLIRIRFTYFFWPRLFFFLHC